MGGLHSIYGCLKEERRNSCSHAFCSEELGAGITLTPAWAGPPAPLGLTSGQAHTKVLPQEEAAALLLLLPGLGDPVQTPALTIKSLLRRDRSKSGTSPFAGVPNCWPPCLHKSEVSMCVFLPTYTISSSWQMNPKASVCIGLINSLLLSVSNVLKYFFGTLFQGCYSKWGSHYWHRRRYCHKPHEISKFIKGQLKQEDCLFSSLKWKEKEKLMQWFNKMRYAMFIKNKIFKWKIELILIANYSIY